ncbi:MAG: amidohydrolase family protein, partial [Dermatophilaceae bacterium]
GMYEARLGPERVAGSNPFAAMVSAGVSLAFGSDSPVTPFDPWAAVRAATAHHDEAQRVDATAAFEAHTRGGWAAAGDDAGGVLAVGRPATFTVWDVDDLDDGGLPALGDGASSPTCRMTVRAGTVLHRA